MAAPPARELIPLNREPAVDVMTALCPWGAIHRNYLNSHPAPTPSGSAASTETVHWLGCGRHDGRVGEVVERRAEVGTHDGSCAARGAVLGRSRQPERAGEAVEIEP
jgi:hypothetical protein